MKPPIPWLRVLIEGVVIVGSILLAFGIQAWWDGRGERLEEQDNLVALLTDMDEVIAEAELRIEQDETRISNVRVRIDSLRSGPPPSDSALVALLYYHGNLRLIRSNLDAYSDLVASGGITSIGDAELRRLLARARYDLDLADRVSEETVERIGNDLVAIMDLAATDPASLSRRLVLYAQLNNRSRQFYVDRKREVLASATAAREAILAAMEGTN